MAIIYLSHLFTKGDELEVKVIKKEFDESLTICDIVDYTEVYDAFYIPNKEDRKLWNEVCEEEMCNNYNLPIERGNGWLVMKDNRPQLLLDYINHLERTAEILKEFLLELLYKGI